MFKGSLQDDCFQDLEKNPPLVEFSLQKQRKSCYTYIKWLFHIKEVVFMRYWDEVHIALMALIFSCTMFAVYAVVPKDAAVAAKAKATVKEAPEAAAEAEALRSSQDTDAGFNIYTEESNYNYDDTSDSTDDTAASDQTTYDPRTYSSDDTTSSDVVDEGTAEDGSYDSSDQIDYPSDDNNGDTPDDNNDYDSSQDNGDYSDDTSEEGSSDNTDSASFDIVTQDSNY